MLQVKSYLSLFMISTTLLVSCSVFSNKTPQTMLPPPPANSANDNSILLPQIGNKIEQNLTESAAAKAHESQPARFKQIHEQRGPGGSINKITVDNPGKLPDYYIYPNQSPTANTNNNPDKISPPNWQWSW